MSRSVVYTLHQWPPIAHAKYHTGSAQRHYDAAGLAVGELKRTRRELAASLALARPGSPARAPILAQMAAIDAELAARDTRPT
jgi:hypothetical protein